MSRAGGFDIQSVFASFLVAVTASALLMPIAIAAGGRLGMVVRPRLFGEAKIPVSQLGGAAVAVAALTAFLILTGGESGFEPFLLGGLWLLVLGSWDDLGSRFISRPRVRLALQLSIATGAWWLGLRALAPGLVGTVGTVLILTASMNSFNLLDNMDGVAGSTGAATAATISGIAAMNGQYLLAVMTAAVCGACIGFLRFNFTSARIYLGNGGSLLLGFLIGGAALSLQVPFEFPWSLIVVASLLAVPALDTSVAVISRLRNGRSVMTGGVDHISHRLVKLGVGKRTAASLHGAVCITSGLAMALAIQMEIPWLMVVLLGLYGVGGLLLLRVPVYEGQQGMTNVPTVDLNAFRQDSTAGVEAVPQRSSSNA